MEDGYTSEAMRVPAGENVGSAAARASTGKQYLMQLGESDGGLGGLGGLCGATSNMFDGMGPSGSNQHVADGIDGDGSTGGGRGAGRLTSKTVATSAGGGMAVPSGFATGGGAGQHNHGSSGSVPTTTTLWWNTLMSGGEATTGSGYLDGDLSSGDSPYQQQGRQSDAQHHQLGHHGSSSSGSMVDGHGGPEFDGFGGEDGIGKERSRTGSGGGEKGGGGSTGEVPRRGRGNRVAKFCDVCGDVAKSNHFGGVSCDSCKAFFRRAVLKDNHLTFKCNYEHDCDISKSTRKQCQACRYKKCLSIGMEPKMVMDDTQRLEFLKRRSKKKDGVVKEMDIIDGPVGSNVSVPSSASTGATGDNGSYSPNPADLSLYMSNEEQAELENMVTKFHQSYVDVPYNVAGTNASRNSIEIIEMFTTILRRMVYFHKMMPDFNSLLPEDQTSLLRQGVLEMCMLRSAFTFDANSNQWPLGAKQAPFQVPCIPQLCSKDARRLVSSELYQMHLRFIASIQSMQVDEKISIIMNHIVLYYPDRIGLKEQGRVAFIQEKYLRYLKCYTEWKYGPYGSRMNAKLLGKLSDLRQLNDSHNEYNLRLAQTEITQIQKTLSSINLNPYPEWEVVRCDVNRGIGMIEPAGRSLGSLFTGSTSSTFVSNIPLPGSVDMLREHRSQKLVGFRHADLSSIDGKEVVLASPLGSRVSSSMMPNLSLASQRICGNSLSSCTISEQDFAHMDGIDAQVEDLLQLHQQQRGHQLVNSPTVMDKGRKRALVNWISSQSNNISSDDHGSYQNVTSSSNLPSYTQRHHPIYSQQGCRQQRTFMEARSAPTPVTTDAGLQMSNHHGSHHVQPSLYHSHIPNHLMQQRESLQQQYPSQLYCGSNNSELHTVDHQAVYLGQGDYAGMDGHAEAEDLRGPSAFSQNHHQQQQHHMEPRRDGNMDARNDGISAFSHYNSHNRMNSSNMEFLPVTVANIVQDRHGNFQQE